MYKGSDRHCLNIKLQNDCFEYISKSGGYVSPRHKSEDWVSLEKERCWDHMPYMKSTLSDLYARGGAIYSVAERLDIELSARDPKMPDLLITFESGYPDIKTTSAYFDI